jgi:hypothetical protein
MNSLNTKKNTIYDAANSGPAMGQAPNCGWIKPVNVIPTLLS